MLRTTSTSSRGVYAGLEGKTSALHARPLPDAINHSKVQELQKEHAEYLEQKKAEALEAIALMDEQVQRKVAQERSSDG